MTKIGIRRKQYMVAANLYETIIAVGAISGDKKSAFDMRALKPPATTTTFVESALRSN